MTGIECRNLKASTLKSAFTFCWQQTVCYYRG